MKTLKQVYAESCSTPWDEVETMFANYADSEVEKEHFSSDGYTFVLMSDQSVWFLYGSESEWFDDVDVMLDKHPDWTEIAEAFRDEE